MTVPRAKKQIPVSPQQYRLFDDFFNTSLEQEQKPATLVETVVACAKQVISFLFSLVGYTPPTGEMTRIQANFSAIERVKQLTSQNQPATPEDCRVLAGFTGWGGLSGLWDEIAYKQIRDGEKSDSLDRWKHKYGTWRYKADTLLTPKQIQSASLSTMTGYYTPPSLLTHIWTLIEGLGFSGGAVLDPASGIGHFTGSMPPDLRANSSVTMIEKDELTSQIARLVYPETVVHTCGFEEAPVQESTFDLIMGNVPFGAFTVYDAQHRDLSPLLIHNYFIAKSVRLAKPGGLVVLLTSMSTLDAGDNRVRQLLEEEGAELIGAIRLPSCTFATHTATEVTTDLLILQKRPDNTPRTALAKPFLHLATLPGQQQEADEPASGDETAERTPEPEPTLLRRIRVNQYFSEFPHHMIGTMLFADEAGSGGLYRGDSQTLFLDQPDQLDDRLAQLIDELVSTVGSVASRFGQIRPVQATKRSSVPQLLQGSIKHKGRLIARTMIYAHYQTLKTDLLSLLKAERQQTDEECTQIRTRLRTNYHQFVTQFGRLTANKTTSWLDAVDPQFSTVQALEMLNRDQTGQALLTESAILTERVFGAVVRPVKADSLEDALQQSLYEYGRIKLPFIAQQLALSEAETKRRLLARELAFINPFRPHLLIDARTYLSGDVRQALEQARQAAETNPDLAPNVAALERIVPPAIPIGAISFQLGSPWLPVTVIKQWINSTFDQSLNVFYSNRSAEYKLDGTVSVTGKVLAMGTPERNALELIEAALNQRSILITKTVIGPDGKPREVKDIDAITAAVQQQEQLQELFIDYATTHHYEELEALFNKQFNSYVFPQYALPKGRYAGASEAVTLREHQQFGTERAKNEDCMLAHWVGTGKTWVMASAGMELIRLGRASKILCAVQNSTVADFANAWKTLYPAALVYAPTEADLTAANRKRFLQRIATNKFHAVIIPQSFLKLIPDSATYEEALIQEEIDRAVDAMEQEAGFFGKKASKRRIKQINLLKARIDARRSAQADRDKDAILTFDQLGIDALFLDEAHRYKRFGFHTKRHQLKGIDTSSSQDAFQAMVKCKTIQAINGRVLLATGTPISNTMAEAWTMLRYLADDYLKANRLGTFDQFAATFGKVVPSFELTTTGNFKVVERFAQFQNVPQLSALYRRFVDVRLAEDVKEFRTGKELPALRHQSASEDQPEGPGFTRIVLEQTPGVAHELYRIRAELYRFNQLSGKEKRENSFIPLVMYGEAKRSTLDVRLLDPTAEDEPGSKLNRAISEIQRVYAATGDVLGTQLVFCDTFQSPASRFTGLEDQENVSVPRFNVYADMTRKLIAGGIPAEVIATVPADKHKREALFARVRTGEIRVLFGSSERMGVGVNVQHRLAAIHHLDAPQRPTDFDQRNGRIIRPGNLFAQWERPVEILTYGVRGTLDATSYGLLAIKQKFINQVLKGASLAETMADITADDDFAAMTFEQMMATLSGNKKALVFTAKSHELNRVKSKKKSFKRNLINAQYMIRKAEQTIALLSQQLPKLDAEAGLVQRCFTMGEDEETFIRSLQVNTTTVTGRKAIWEALQQIFKTVQGGQRMTVSINELPVKLSAQRDADVFIDEPEVYFQYGLNLLGSSRSPQGFIHSLRAATQRVLKAPGLAHNQLKQAIDQQTEFTNLLAKPFRYEDELTRLTQEVNQLQSELIAEQETQANPQS